MFHLHLNITPWEKHEGYYERQVFVADGQPPILFIQAVENDKGEYRPCFLYAPGNGFKLVSGPLGGLESSKAYAMSLVDLWMNNLSMAFANYR